MCSMPDQCQFNSTAVSEEVCSEPALNCVWHLRDGVVNRSLEYLVLAEVCTRNTLFLCDLFQVEYKNKNGKKINNCLPGEK